MNKSLYLCCIVLIIIFLNSCNKIEQRNPISDNLKGQKDIQDGLNKIDEQKKLIDLKQNEEIKKQEILNYWVGKYEFSESAKELNGITSMVWNYKITIKKTSDADLEASIYVEGFQTLPKTIKCKVEIDSNKINLYSKQNGALQLSLEKNVDGKILTNWKAFQPNIDKKNGKVRFRKTK